MHDIKTLNKKKLIKTLYPNSIFIYYSALDLLRKNYFEVLGSYVIATPTLARPLELEDIDVTPIKMQIPCGLIKTYVDQEELLTTDEEMTFIMCIDNLKYSMGLENLNKAFRKGEGLELKKIRLCKHLTDLQIIFINKPINYQLMVFPFF